MATEFDTPETLDSGTQLPSYLVAANTHNIANGEYSMFDSLASTATASVISGAVQALNIVPTIGNWFGGEFEQLKTAEVINDFDSDLGKYYSERQEGIDTLGFMLGSVVPGMAGVKVLKAGQVALRSAAEAGHLGKNLGSAFGLLPTQPKMLSQAIEAALKPNAGFPIWNSQTAKAVAAGFGQAALEGAAWETAVAATMYNGPILENQDFGDITSNILHGAVAFGALGGTLHTASTYSKIKRAGADLDRVAMPWNIVRESHALASPSDKILNLLDEYHNTPEVPKGMFVGDQAWKINKLESLKQEKFRYIDTKVREISGELTGGDQTLATHLYDSIKKWNLGDAEAKLFGTESMSRLGQKSVVEQRLAKIENELAAKLEIGNVEDFQFWKTRERTYVKLTGEGAGTVTSELPKVWNLGDTLAKGEVISVGSRGVTAGKRSFKFREGVAWNALEASNHLEAEARQIWASKLGSFAEKEAELGIGASIKIAENDLPLLEKAWKDGITPRVELLDTKAGARSFYNRDDFFQFLVEKKQAVYDSAIGAGKSGEEAAKLANISDTRALGVIDPKQEKGLFAFQEAAENYKQNFAASGRVPPGEYYDSPTWAKTIKDTSEITVDGNIVDGLVAIKQKQKLYEQAAERAVGYALGEDSQKFARVSDTLLNRMNRTGPGGGMLGAQNENYGTLGSMCQYLGSQTLKTIQKAQAATREVMSPALYKLGQNEAAAIEWSVLQQRIRQFGSTPFGYDAEQQAMRPLALIKYERSLAEGVEATVPILDDSIPLAIPVKHPETVAVITDHLQLNASRVEKLGAIRTNQGVTWNRDPERFYPIPPNTKDFPYFASVVDDSIAGHGHGKMVYAATAEDLEKQITQIKAADPTLKVLTKSDAESWYKSIGQYEFERTLTDVAFDGALASKGVSANYLPATSVDKIISETLNWHLGRDSSLVRDAVAHLNEVQIGTLRTMGEKYAAVQGSHFSKLDPVAYLEMQGKNPYADYVRSMLGLSTSKEFPFWTPMNDMLDRKVSGLFNKVYETFSQAKSPAELELINKSLADAGYQGAPYSAMTHAFANHTAPKGALSSFIAKANAILSSTMIGMDPINALNNTVGSVVLRSTELKSLLRAIGQGNTEVAGELARVSTLKVPGTANTIFSPAKMYAEAMTAFHSPEGRLLREEFKGRGIISSRVEQANWVLENLALTGKESVGDLDGKIATVFNGLKKAAATGEKVTGNALAEEFNRFVSGHIAKQITDRAVTAGVIGEKEAWAYVNTFVNRVEGNYIAAQRPGVFQGPIGQAIGLFQTYQFNLMQQLLRHVGEGSGKDVALMMGLQSTIFGMKGLPAFDAINTHLLGTASGNTQHRDLYSTVYGAVGKEAGDWLVYGAGSNALGLISPELKFNLYTRGDINPRNVTLLPVNPANIPFVQAAGKFYSSIAETAQKISQGGQVWGSILQGIEHSGVSRPLAGLAQTLQATGNPLGKSFSTSNAGNVVASNDWNSLTSLIRIAGAKPLDEAIGIDRAYNLEVYAAKDTAKRKALGETIKTTLIAGNNPTQEQVESFAESYAKMGGKRERFNQYMVQQYKAANTSQVNKLAENLKSPFSQSMQQIMGDNLLADFSR